MKELNTNDNYIVIDGVIYSADKRVLLKYLPDREGETFYIPDFVEEISPSAFEDTRKLKNVYIGKKVKKIYGDGVCGSIEKVFISPSVADIAHQILPYAGDGWDLYDHLIVGGAKGSRIEEYVNRIAVYSETISFVEVSDDEVKAFFDTPTYEFHERRKRQFEENEYIVDMSDCGYIAKLVGDTLEILPAQGATAPITVGHKLYTNFCKARRDKIRRVVFGDGICGVGEYEFTHNRYLNVTSIHLGADMEFDAPRFYEMYGLSEITCSEENPRYQVSDNVLYSRDLKTLVGYMPGKPEEYFAVPDHVEHLASNAFMYANNLQCVKVGKNVKSIGDQCFYDCFDLRHVYIGEGVESIVGEYVFALTNDYGNEPYLTREHLVIGGKAHSTTENWCSEINRLYGEYGGENCE